MSSYLATNLLRHHEATLALEELYGDANYMLRILTCARAIADHPDQERPY